MHGLPLWAISIGLIDDGEPVLGVIAVPPLSELYWAVKGQGAWLDGQRLEAEDADVFHPQDNVCVGTNALRVIDPARSSVACATWGAPAANRSSWPPAGCRPARSLARPRTTSLPAW